LHRVEPFDRAGLLDAGAHIRRSAKTAAAATTAIRPEGRARPRRGRAGRAAVDADDLGDLRASLAGGDPDLQRLARLYRRVAAAPKDARVKKGVACPVRQLNEPEALVGIEPFHHRSDRGTGGCLLEPRCGTSGIARWRTAVIPGSVVIVVVKATPAPLPITSIRFQVRLPKVSKAGAHCQQLR